MQRELTDKNLEYEIIEWICQNDKDFNEAKLHGYDLRMDEPEIIYWMKKYADYKSRLAENLVSQAASQAVPKPNAVCENCKQYKPYDEGLGECKWFSNKTKVDYIFTAKDFFCKQFEQK